MVVLEVILFFYLLYWLVRSLPRIIVVILLLPIAPFVCFWETRKEHPFVAWLLVVLLAMLLGVILLVCAIR
jgi:hypothetical protein